jgi:hypothetical protein
MTRTTITGMRGTPLPNLEAHGLHRKMKPAATLISEQGRLLQRAKELGYERQRLEAAIKQREYEHTQAWGRAMRSGEDVPTDENIEKANKRLEEVAKESAAVRHAGELADAELKETIAEHREEWDAEVQAKGERILAEAAEIADTLSRHSLTSHGCIVLASMTSPSVGSLPSTMAARSLSMCTRSRWMGSGLTYPTRKAPTSS